MLQLAWDFISSSDLQMTAKQPNISFKSEFPEFNIHKHDVETFYGQSSNHQHS